MPRVWYKLLTGELNLSSILTQCSDTITKFNSYTSYFVLMSGANEISYDDVSLLFVGIELNIYI